MRDLSKKVEISRAVRQKRKFMVQLWTDTKQCLLDRRFSCCGWYRSGHGSHTNYDFRNTFDLKLEVPDPCIFDRNRKAIIDGIDIETVFTISAGSNITVEITDLGPA